MGDHKGLVIPPLKRERQTENRLRGLRLIHTHLKGEPLNQDDLMDLALLRLDFIVALETMPQGLPGRLYGAHLLPQRVAERDWEFITVDHVSHLELDFAALVQSLEAELSRAGRLGVDRDRRERAILIGVTTRPRHSAEDSLMELRELAGSAGLQVVDSYFAAAPAHRPPLPHGPGQAHGPGDSSLAGGCRSVDLRCRSEPLPGTFHHRFYRN